MLRGLLGVLHPKCGACANSDFVWLRQATWVLLETKQVQIASLHALASVNQYRRLAALLRGRIVHRHELAVMVAILVPSNASARLAFLRIAKGQIL